MIDYVLAKTGHEKLQYVGHSMGTTGFFVAMDKRPEYQEKVIMAHLLAPVAYVENMISPISWLAPFVEELEVIFRLRYETEVFVNVTHTGICMRTFSSLFSVYFVTHQWRIFA